MSEENGEDIFGFLSGPEAEDPNADGGSVEFSNQLFGGPNKDAVLFCIDCLHLHKLMEESDSESKYEVALRAMYSFMRNKVVASDGSDMTGLIFYNVSKAGNPLRQKRINLVQPLATLSARCIQEVGELSRLSESDFSVRFGDPTSDADISDLLFVCNAQFKKISVSYRPRMFIFTSNDDPCGTDRKARKAAHTRAADFHEGMSQGAEINLIPFLLGMNHHDFDVTKFWEPILLLSSRVDEEMEGGDSGERKEQFVQNSVLQLSDMNEISLKKLFKKRPVNRINFFISSSAKVALMMYTSYYAAGKPKHMYVDPDTFEPLRSETRFISDFSGAVLDAYSDEIKTFVDFQGKQVPLTKQDILAIKRMDDVTDNKGGVSGSLHLIGFRPLSFLKPEYCVGHSCFLYPQDERISGSSLIVSALINRLHQRRLIAIARAVPKANSSLQLVALVPQVEVLDAESGRQEKSPGLFLVRLPFADDLRDLTLNETNVAFMTKNNYPEQESGRNEQVSAAKRIVEALSEPHWEPDMLDNPALKVCYTCIEAIALAIPPDQTVQVDDLLHPDPQKAEAAQHVSSDWLNTMNMLDTSACALASGGAMVKKIKVEANADDSEKLWTEVEVKHLIETGMIAKLTVPDLKLVIKQIDKLKHLSTQGRKEELINKIKFNINI